MTEISDIDNCLYLFNTKRLMSLYVFFSPSKHQCLHSSGNLVIINKPLY